MLPNDDKCSNASCPAKGTRMTEYKREKPSGSQVLTTIYLKCETCGRRTVAYQFPIYGFYG